MRSVFSSVLICTHPQSSSVTAIIYHLDHNYHNELQTWVSVHEVLRKSQRRRTRKEESVRHSSKCSTPTQMTFDWHSFAERNFNHAIDSSLQSVARVTPPVTTPTTSISWTLERTSRRPSRGAVQSRVTHSALIDVSISHLSIN